MSESQYIEALRNGPGLICLTLLIILVLAACNSQTFTETPSLLTTTATSGAGVAAHDLGLVGVEPAAEGDDPRLGARRAHEAVPRPRASPGASLGAIEHPRLLGAVACDVCVIGGGFTGLSTALHLAERGYDVVLLEARRTGWGASGRNGGQLGSGQRQPQGELERLVGAAQARALWNLAEEAKATVKERIRRHDIPCDLKSGALRVAYKPGDAAMLAAQAKGAEIITIGGSRLLVCRILSINPPRPA